jgi:cytochrome c oxidase subunit II
MKKIYWLLPCALLLGILLAVGCSRPAATAPSGPSPAPAEPLSGSVVNGAREVKVEAHKFAYNPDSIVVKKGEKVRLLITATDVQHGFALPDLKIDVKLPPNKEQVVEFTPDKAGEFPFHCSVYCGSGHGDMKGILLVKE